MVQSKDESEECDLKIFAFSVNSIQYVFRIYNNGFLQIPTHSIVIFWMLAKSSCDVIVFERQGLDMGDSQCAGLAIQNLECLNSFPEFIAWTFLPSAFQQVLITMFATKGSV